MERVTITVHHFVTAVTVVLTLTALIIASIAVSGNIDWKDNSIPDTAIKVQDQNMDLGLFLKTADSSFFNATAVQIEDGGLAAVPASSTDAVHYSDLKHLRGHNAEVTSSGAHTVVDEDGLALKSGSGKYTLLKAFNSLAPSYTLTLPADAGTADQVLKTDGNGNLRFDDNTTTSATSVTLDGINPAQGAVTLNGNGQTISMSSTAAITINSISDILTLDGGSQVVIQSVDTKDDAIRIEATNEQGGIKLSCGSNGIAIDSAGPINIGATEDAGAINIGTNATGRTVTVGNAAVTSNVDINVGTGAFTVDCADGGSISLDGNGAPCNFTLASTADGDDLTISVTGTNNSSLILRSEGTGSDAISLNATAGGIDISGNGEPCNFTLVSTADGDDLTISVTGVTGTATNSSLILSSEGTGSDAISLTATAGGIDIDSAGGIDIDSTGPINIGATEDAGAINIGTNATDRTVTVGNAAVTSNVDINVGTGAFTVDCADGGSISLDGNGAPCNFTLASTADGDDLTISVTGTNNSSLILRSEGTESDAISLNATAGGIDIDSAGGIDIDSSGSIIFKISSDTDDDPVIIANTQPGGPDDPADDDTIRMELYGRGKSSCVIRSSDGRIADDVWPGWSGGIHTNDILFSSGKCRTLISTNKIGISPVEQGTAPYWGDSTDNDSPQVELDVNGVARVSRLGVRTQPLGLEENTVDIAIGDPDTGFKQKDDGILAILCNASEKVIINKSNTGRGCIDVKGVGAGQSNSFAFFKLFNSAADSGANTSGNLIPYAIYADGRIAATEFNAVSDDRLKIQEEYITNATDTLMKLRPQNYYKKSKLETEFQGELDEWNTKKSELRDKIDVIENIQEADRTEEQISNLSIYNDQMSKLIEKEPKNDAWLESGLIAQEVFYDTPELRHIVTTGMNPNDISETPPEGYYNPDPSIDPDYSNWGETPANLKYNNFIAYLIKGFQEQQAIITDLQQQSVSQQAIITDLQQQSVSQQAIITDLQQQSVSQQAIITDLQQQSVSQQAIITDLQTRIDNLENTA